MSRIGKRAVEVPQGVTATLEDRTISVKGPKGELRFVANDEVLIDLAEDSISVQPKDSSKDARAKWGMTRTMIANLVTGVTKGFERRLEISGVGYRAAAQGNNKVQLTLGYSHDVSYEAPPGVTLATPRPTEIVVTGIDKQQVGQVAAELRNFRRPEPYKGKGIKYAEEKIFRKEGKKK